MRYSRLDTLDGYAIVVDGYFVQPQVRSPWWTAVTAKVDRIFREERLPAAPTASNTIEQRSGTPTSTAADLLVGQRHFAAELAVLTCYVITRYQAPAW